MTAARPRAACIQCADNGPQSSGTSSPSSTTPPPAQASRRHPDANPASVALPCLLVAGINGKMRWDAHWEHVAHGPPKEEKPEYAYQNIRTKNFFWGDGDKVSTTRFL